MAAIPTHTFALVVCRLGDRFLLVQERKHEQSWYLPAGKVDAGEQLTEAALRETREEAGLDIELEGVLRVEYTPWTDGSARLRVFFLARPKDPIPALKAVPDEHSLGARWVRLDELGALALRGDEVPEVLTHVARGGPVFPLAVLATRLQPWPRET